MWGGGPSDSRPDVVKKDLRFAHCFDHVRVRHPFWYVRPPKELASVPSLLLLGGTVGTVGGTVGSVGGRAGWSGGKGEKRGNQLRRWEKRGGESGEGVGLISPGPQIILLSRTFADVTARVDVAPVIVPCCRCLVLLLLLHSSRSHHHILLHHLHHLRLGLC